MFLVIFFIVLLFIPAAYAESIFLRDGSITEASVLSETDRSIRFKTAEGRVREIPRRDVIRIIHHADYKDKKYIYKTDKSLVEAFIVDEDLNFYTCRAKLDAADEFKLLKNEVETISKKKIEFSSDNRSRSRREEIVSRASLIRLAAGISDQYPELDDGGANFNMDIFLYRMRNNDGNGFDFFGSVLHKEFQGMDQMGREDAEVIAEKYGYTLQSTDSYTSLDIVQTGIGAGVRYIHGYYFAGIFWQGYLSGSVNSIWNNFSESGEYETKSRYTGLIANAGIEAAPFSYFGVFAETGITYMPAAENYKVSQNIYFGIILRTSYL